MRRALDSKLVGDALATRGHHHPVGGSDRRVRPLIIEAGAMAVSAHDVSVRVTASGALSHSCGRLTLRRSLDNADIQGDPADVGEPQGFDGGSWRQAIDYSPEPLLSWVGSSAEEKR